MSTELLVEHLRGVVKQRSAVRGELDVLENEVQKTIIAALNRGGATVLRDVMDATGYSKSRVYQIRDGRR